MVRSSWRVRREPSINSLGEAQAGVKAARGSSLVGDCAGKLSRNEAG